MIRPPALLFGVPIADTREVWDEALRVICGLFVHDTFPGHKGRHYEIPERKLVPVRSDSSHMVFTKSHGTWCSVSS